MPSSEGDVPLTLAVFNAASTPESENHGRFIDALQAAIGVPLAVVIDTTPYRQRLGAQSGAAERLNERCQAWRAFVEAHELSVACVDLAAPDIDAAERDLAAALGGSL